MYFLRAHKTDIGPVYVPTFSNWFSYFETYQATRQHIVFESLSSEWDIHVVHIFTTRLANTEKEFVIFHMSGHLFQNSLLKQIIVIYLKLISTRSIWISKLLLDKNIHGAISRYIAIQYISLLHEAESFIDRKYRAFEYQTSLFCLDF